MRSTSQFVADRCSTVAMSFPGVFSWDYEHQDEHLVRLYDKAKRSQWNAATDIDWSVEVTPSHLDPGVMATLRDGVGSPFAHLSDAELVELGWESQAWTVSQFLHGEQGALLATAKLVDAVPDEDAKLYAATQVVDEARHVEVYHRYLSDKLDRSYPINVHLQSLLHDLLTDSRWDVTYLGMQIMVESLALAAFGFIYQTTNEPLLRTITSRVMADEARHVAFGIASLTGVYDEMTEHERHDREVFVCEAAELMRDRFLQREVWERAGLPADQCEAFVRGNPVQVQFRSLLFSKVVPNVKRIGLLTPYVREQFKRLGILSFESEPASA